MSNPVNGPPGEKTYFEQQREILIGDIATASLPTTPRRVGMENVLQNINKLNRSLEGVIAVGNEFSQVEGLWSQFENVMAKQPTAEKEESKEGAAEEQS